MSENLKNAYFGSIGQMNQLLQMQVRLQLSRDNLTLLTSPNVSRTKGRYLVNGQVCTNNNESGPTL